MTDATSPASYCATSAGRGTLTTTPRGRDLPYTEITACRICGNRRLLDILSMGRQALTGVFPRTKDEPVDAGPLDLVKCDESAGWECCGLVQLKQSFDKNAMYSDRYGYRSGLNQSMVRHLQAKVAKILDMVILRPGDVVIDIGSNDGTLLSAYPPVGPQLVGIDPTAEKFRSFYPPQVEILPEFFSAAAVRKVVGDGQAKIITSIAMFYDLESPTNFVSQIKSLLADDGVWVLEQSYLPQMMAMGAYDTVCHEHLEYYGLKQIKWMTDRIGLKIVALEQNEVNGGSFSVTIARPSARYPECSETIARCLEAERPLSRENPYRAFRDDVFRHREELVGFLQKVRASGKTVAGYGASTKGNVILQFCGLSDKDIPRIGEVNRDKFGCFTPGTLIPIVPEDEVRAARPDYLVVLPWHFRSFIVKKERAYLEAGGRLFFPLPRPEVCS